MLSSTYEVFCAKFLHTHVVDKWLNAIWQINQWVNDFRWLRFWSSCSNLTLMIAVMQKCGAIHRISEYDAMALHIQGRLNRIQDNVKGIKIKLINLVGGLSMDLPQMLYKSNYFTLDIELLASNPYERSSLYLSYNASDWLSPIFDLATSLRVMPSEED